MVMLPRHHSLPDHAPHLWRPFSHVQVFSHCAEQRCLPSSALAIRSRCGFTELWGMVRRSPWGRKAAGAVGSADLLWPAAQLDLAVVAADLLSMSYTLSLCRG